MMSTMKGDTPQTGAGDLTSFFPRPTMHTYFALPPSRAEDELPCADRQSSLWPFGGFWTGQLLHWAVESSYRAVAWREDQTGVGVKRQEGGADPACP